jgi:acetyl esterase/lipase
MTRRISAKNRFRHRRPKRIHWPFWVIILILIGTGLVYKHYDRPPLHADKKIAAAATRASNSPSPTPAPIPDQAGTVVEIVSQQHYSAAQVTALSRQNYGNSFIASARGVTQLVIQYRTTDQNGNLITDYAQVYIPDTVISAPILAMAPGTTGDSPNCSTSLEQPSVRNWANYKSHMMAYASHGYTGVITDYDNMRGTTGPQPYMIGVAEGRAVLDSIRALRQIPTAEKVSNFNQIFVAGYSQGGNSAFWAANINHSYAPDVKLAGAIGWGPVLNIETTWQGITDGSTLDWFGPALLLSYENYYQHNYNINNILLPQWSNNLYTDVMGHCIDTDIAFWGINPNKVYTPQFISDLKTGNLSGSLYGPLQQDLEANQAVGASSTPKLVNQGELDNVVLPHQQIVATNQLCGDGDKVELALYAKATHYDLMVQSFKNTIAWMEDVQDHSALPNICH